jgi:hypothetical protein
MPDCHAAVLGTFSLDYNHLSRGASLLLEGMSEKQAANELSLSIKTVHES